MFKNLYDILQISLNVTDQEINKSFRQLAKTFHPDKQPKNDDTKFKQINQAFEVLGDPDKRKSYDLLTNTKKVEESKNNKKIKQSESVQLVLTLQESFFGCAKPIKFSWNAQCDLCKGKCCKSGVNLPNCIQCNGSGTTLVQRQIQISPQQHILQHLSVVCNGCQGFGLLNTAETSCEKCKGNGLNRLAVESEIIVLQGTSSGCIISHVYQNYEMFIQIQVVQDPNWIWKENNLLYQPMQEISLGEVLFGSFKTLPHAHPNGEQISITIDPGNLLPNQNNLTVIGRIESLGMPKYGSIKLKGELVITFCIKFPSKETIDECLNSVSSKEDFCKYHNFREKFCGYYKDSVCFNSKNEDQKSYQLINNSSDSTNSSNNRSSVNIQQTVVNIQNGQTVDCKTQ